MNKKVKKRIIALPYLHEKYNRYYKKKYLPPPSVMVTSSASGEGGRGFDSGQRPTVDINQRINGPVNAHLRSGICDLS